MRIVSLRSFSPLTLFAFVCSNISVVSALLDKPVNGMRPRDVGNVWGAGCVDEPIHAPPPRIVKGECLDASFNFYNDHPSIRKGREYIFTNDDRRRKDPNYIVLPKRSISGGCKVAWDLENSADEVKMSTDELVGDTNYLIGLVVDYCNNRKRFGSCGLIGRDEREAKIRVKFVPAHEWALSGKVSQGSAEDTAAFSLGNGSSIE